MGEEKVAVAEVGLDLSGDDVLVYQIAQLVDARVGIGVVGGDDVPEDVQGAADCIRGLGLGAASYRIADVARKIVALFSWTDDTWGWTQELVLLELEHVFVVVVADLCDLEAVPEPGEGGLVVVVVRRYLGGPVVVLGS